MNGVALFYKEFKDADYTKFRFSLLHTKGGARQRDFLNATRSAEEFLEFVRTGLATEGAREPPLCPERLTEEEFKFPPVSTEKGLYSVWKDLTPGIACRATFWANLTCRHIEEGKIDAIYLAGKSGANASGAERIDHVLQDDRETAANQIDLCVRAVLRRLSGLPGRGNRSVYVDCPFARAWWRGRLVADISQGDKDRADIVWAVVRVNQTFWETLVNPVVSRNSVLGSHEVRNAFIVSLADLMAKEPETPLRNHKNLQLASRKIGIIQASRELSVLDEGEVRDIMADIVKLQHEQALALTADGKQPSAVEPESNGT